MGCTLALVGGNWNNGANAGLSYWDLDNSSGNANVNVGRQTLISGLHHSASHIPHRLVKMQPHRAGLSRVLEQP